MKSRTLISLVAGIGIFVVAVKFLKGYKFLSILLALIGFILVRRIITLVMKAVRKDGDKKAAGNDRNGEIVKESVDKLRGIRKNTGKIYDNAVAEKVVAICRTGLEICDYISAHPEDLSRARQFINYYIEAFEKIVSQYVELSSRKEGNPELEASLKRVEGVLDTIHDTYKKQLKYLLEDDILDLNTEITVLEKTMKMEG